MASERATSGHEHGHTPADWSDEAERTYAQRQADLAAHYGVDIESRTTETEAGQIHYLVAGDPAGKPVLLLHGVSTTAATWLPLATALTDSYRLYIPDRPGRGLSGAPSYEGRDLRQFMVEYLVELLDSEGIQRPHVVGNSLGGQQAFLLALDHGRVDRLAQVGAPGGVSKEFSLMWRLMTVRGVNRALTWLVNRGDPVENARDQTDALLVVDDSAVSDGFYELFAAAGELPGREASLRSLQEAQASFGQMHDLFDLSDEIVTIERPTCFIWGDRDSFWEPEVGRPVAEQMADAEFVELPDHGHMPWLEPDDAVETALRAFLDG
jgi:pimeloyl-ACP methyl ester carboxylesterase